MATESAVNGTYPPHPAYATVDQTQAAYNANNMSSQLSYQNPTASSTAAAAASTATQSTSNPANDIPKDEVGWYFVEQYYTTLSRSPEKLFVSISRPFLRRTLLTTPSFSTTNDHSSSLETRPRRLLFQLAPE